jgi:ATP-dependent helicase HrpB
MPGEPDEFLVAMDVEDRGDRPVIRLACPIEPDWLLDYTAERSRVEWNRQAQRVEAVNAWLYDQLVIDETRGGPVDDEEAARVLAEKATEAGIERFVDRGELDSLRARIEFAGLGVLDDGGILEALTELCYGLRSFADVEQAAAGLIPILEDKAGRQALEEFAPARLRLPSGRQTKVNYERGKTPWVASRLQDFFGMTESPRIGRHSVPVVIHLLAPSQRPVQTTTDLAGFWIRLYPQLRKELGRRYPKHAWPERPV